MLVIRMQRTGRKGHAQFRVVVQDSRRTPTSGKVVAALGHFNPHTKETSLNKEKASFYLEHGAQPSERVVRLLKSEGVKMPNWVAAPTKKTGEVKNAEKRRSTAPPAPKEEKPADEPVLETEAPVEPVDSVPEETLATEPANKEPTTAATEEVVAEITPAEPEVTADETPAEEAVESAEEAAAEVPAEQAEPQVTEKPAK